MPGSWSRALNHYSYPVDLRTYNRGHEFPGFFNRCIAGDRNSTIAFENFYQAHARSNIAAYFEVVYWKLYALPHVRQRATDRIVDSVQQCRIKPSQLWDAIRQFVSMQTPDNLRKIRKLLGIKNNVIGVPLTLVALAEPSIFPMIDNQTAKWVNANMNKHNINRLHPLTQFNLNYNVLKDNDFDNYRNWIDWCREVAQVLTARTEIEWRARDVEMAVFTAQRNKTTLNALPPLLNRNSADPNRS